MKTESDIDGQKENKKISYWNRVTLGHFNRVIYRGLQGTISTKDLVPLEDDLSSKLCFEKFERKWLERQQKERQEYAHKAVSSADGEEVITTPDDVPLTSSKVIWLSLLYSFYPSMIQAFLIELFLSGCRLMPALIIGELIGFVESSKPNWYGYLLCIALALINDFTASAVEHLLYTNNFIAIKARSALMTAIYEKALILSMESQQAYPLGELMNLMSVDAEKVFAFFQQWHLLWSWTWRLGGSLAIIWTQLGLSTLAGVAVVLSTMPISGFAGSRIAVFQAKQMEQKGQRLSVLTEVLSGIKCIKLYAWEEVFSKKLKDIRAIEVKYVKLFLYYQVVLSFIWNCTPFLISLASFGCFVLISNETLTPRRVFVSMSLFSGLRYSLTFLPSILSSFTRCRVSLRRIQNFLQADEFDSTEVQHNVREGNIVEMENASFSWDPSSALEDLNLSVREGELLAVIGSVGSGKSSLLSAILGCMNKKRGHLRRKQVAMAYVPQQAWILNTSVRRNITFTSAFEENWYNSVVDKCSLIPDLSILENGDQTQIGEKGINLSGGQKQRISLARAVYQKAELFLLDDPLSAVDAHVLQDLFKNVIGPQGILKNKTRVLVTHCQAVLPFVDRIVLMKEGKISFTGTYEELIKQDVSLKTALKEEVEEHEKETEEMKTTSDKTDSGNEEEIVQGNVQWDIYWLLLKRFGIFYAVVSLCSYIVYQLGLIAGMFWLRFWSEDSKITKNHEIRMEQLKMDSNMTEETVQQWQIQSAQESFSRLSVFIGFGGVQFFGSLVACFILVLGTVKASSGLHNAVFNCLMRAPLQFFDKTPSGRIVNRMSKDVDVIDLDLCVQLDSYIATVAGILSAILLLSYEVPVILAVMVPCAMVFVVLLKIFMRNSRQLQRLSSVNRSPVLNHFSETVNGTSSIKAFNAGENFIREFRDRLDLSHNCILHDKSSATWVSLRVHGICNILVLCLGALIVYHRQSVDSGLVGLLLTYIIITVDDVSWLFRVSSALENAVISVERLHEYSSVPGEKEWTIKGAVDPLWPSAGSMKFASYSTGYRENQCILKDLNITIQPNEKVGLVGRTGAGKSSFTMALFRAIEATKGSIHIDNVDVSNIGLHDLRRRLTIIPQDPILFRGTLRFNLDPEGRHSDEELWSAIEKAHLNKAVFQLKMQISDGGLNLSVGERQLISFARALLRRSKIIVLDEATAAIDHKTDLAIQETIKFEFEQSTVITIAHRLNTVLSYDKIVVLSAGQVVEEGSPHQLLNSKDSMFYSMAKDAGLV